MIVLLAALPVLSPVSPAAHATPVGPIISTVAGTGDDRAYGDGGPAAKAGIDLPGPLAFAPDGTLYLVDGYTVRSISPHGTIDTIAGTGKKGFSGDGGPATKATFGQITGLAVGPDGTLYIADAENLRVRAVDPHSRKVRTVAGGAPGADDPSEDAFRGEGGPATSAHLADPETGIAVGPDGTLYIGDDFRVLAVDPSEHTIRTVAGTGNRFPNADPSGNAATRTSFAPQSLALGDDGSL